MGPRPHLWIFAFKTATLALELLVSMGLRPHLWFLHAKRRLLDQNCKSLWVPALICGFRIQACDFSTRIESLYGSQPSSLVLCIHNSDIMTRINSLYGSQTSPVVLCMQNMWLAPELLVSMGPRPHLSYCACKTAWLAPELLVSMGLSHHLWVLYAKERLLDKNNKCLWVPHLTYRFVNAKYRD